MSLANPLALPLALAGISLTFSTSACVRVREGGLVFFWVFVCVYSEVFVHVCACVCTCVHMSVFACVCVCVCVSARTVCVCVYMRVLMFVCWCLCVFVVVFVGC